MLRLVILNGVIPKFVPFLITSKCLLFSATFSWYYTDIILTDISDIGILLLNNITIAIGPKIHCHTWDLIQIYICMWVPDVGSSHCQRWWLCQQTAGWGPDLPPGCWAGTQSIQTPGRWMSSAACRGPLPWWFLKEEKIINCWTVQLNW